MATPFFPLDEALNLAPGPWTPLLQEGLVRLGSLLPFRQAAQLFAHFVQTPVGADTVRRTTLAMGRQCAQLQEEVPPPDQLPMEDAGPRQLLSSDGSMVPLLGGEWAEVKCLVLGTVAPPVLEQGEWVIHSHHLSYFARLTDAATFTELARAEVAHRATAHAATVCAVSDGAPWIQSFITAQAAHAVRILDFPHAAGYLMRASQAYFGAESAQASAWFATQRHELKHGCPQRVLHALLDLALTAYDQNRPAEVQATLHEAWHYLAKRRTQIAYAHFQACGYPIGSGAVESANKGVVAQRLKGAGMHWARASVNPMLALTTLTANQRWAASWSTLVQRARHHSRRRRAPHPLPALPTPVATPTPVPTKPPYRPPASHPWRRSWGRRGSGSCRTPK